MSVPTNYRFELGFHRGAAPIVTPILDKIGHGESPEATAEARTSADEKSEWNYMEVYPLQGQLVRIGRNCDDQSPAWCTSFSEGDSLAFRLVDITDLRNPQSDLGAPKDPRLSFRDSMDGSVVDPFFEEVRCWGLGKAFQQWSPVFSRDRLHVLQTWDIKVQVTGLNSTLHVLDGLRFAEKKDVDFSCFELSVGVTVARIDGERRPYVFDPECIVSGGGH